MKKLRENKIKREVMKQRRNRYLAMKILISGTLNKLKPRIWLKLKISAACIL